MIAFVWLFINRDIKSSEVDSLSSGSSNFTIGTETHQLDLFPIGNQSTTSLEDLKIKILRSRSDEVATDFLVTYDAFLSPRAR